MAAGPRYFDEFLAAVSAMAELILLPEYLPYHCLPERFMLQFDSDFEECRLQRIWIVSSAYLELCRHLLH